MEFEKEKCLHFIFLMQSQIHLIDELSLQPQYVKEIKMRTNRYLRFIDPKINQILKSFRPRGK